jgi:O-antigen ligase
MCAGFMAVIAANGDAAIIGVLAGFAVLLWYAFEDQTKLRRYLIASALFFTCALIVGNMDQSFADSVKEPLDTFPSLVATSLMSKIAALLLWCLVIFFMSIKKKDVDEGLLKKLRNLIFGAAAIAALTALSVFIWFSFFDRDRDLGVWDTYLRFSDLWGSSRGFTWKRTFILFRDHFDLLQKLFGFGPDLLIVPYHTFFHEEIFEKMGAYLADAHSEFFQILGSMGLAGTVAYFGFQISSAVRIARHRSSSPLMPGVMASIAGYMVQGMLCSPQTFSTPALFIMIGVGEMLVRRSKEMDSQ